MNLQRLIELENLEQGLRVDMKSPFLDGSREELHYPCGTACCHAGWGAILAYSSGFPDADLSTPCNVTIRYFDLHWDVAIWLCNAHAYFQGDWYCSEREGRLRLRILIELQSDDVALLTAELKRRMAEPVEAPVVEEMRVEVMA